MDWRDQVLVELAHAREARLAGNEGRARVCARRAAGVIVGEYYQRLGRPTTGRSAFSRLQYLANEAETSAEVRQAAEHFILRITPEHELPVDVDLVAKVHWLAQELLQEQV